MNGYVFRLGSAALAACALVRPATAQLNANPVYYSPKAPVGLTLAADFGTTLQTKSGGLTSTLKPNNVGVRALLGLPIINVGVGGGIWNSDVPGADKETQFMATAALKVFSPPLLPVGVAVQAGAGYLQIGSGTSAVKSYNVPIGVGVSIKPPTPGLSVEPWAGPRIQVQRTSAGGSSETRFGVGASGGINLGMPMGLGLHAALDWATYAAKGASPKIQTMVFGIGLHYTFTIPGLPLVPVI